jgi:hypothetical protein
VTLLDALSAWGASRTADSGGMRLAFQPAVLALDRAIQPIRPQTRTPFLLSDQ